jgi:hypothetical protein
MNISKKEHRMVEIREFGVTRLESLKLGFKGWGGGWGDTAEFRRNSAVPQHIFRPKLRNRKERKAAERKRG